MKSVEKMVEADPEAAREKLMHLEEETILERATLKVGFSSASQPELCFHRYS